MKKRKKTERLPLLGMLLTTVLVLGGLYAVHWWSESRAAIYEQRAQEAVERGDWAQAASLGEKAEAAGAEDTVNELTYKNALALFDAGDYEAARDLFAGLGAYEDAPRLALGCTYHLAERAEAAGELETALQGYLDAVGYEDALARADGCRYAMAERSLDAGDDRAAFQQFLDLGDFRDARQRARTIAVVLTEEPDEELALLLAQGYTADDWENRARLSRMHQSLASHRLAAGRGHAAFLTEQGTVLAAGDNAHGQCNVQDWTNVAAIDAGYAHTLALTADGRVLAAGDDSCGQCGVGDWTGVVKIFCGPWDSYGLREDGTILHCGYSNFSTLSGWTGVTALGPGNGALFGVRQNGTLLSDPAVSGKDWQGLLAVAAAGHAPAGLREDGTVLYDGHDLSGWTDVVALDSSPTLLVGLKVDGTLLVQPLMPADGALLSALLAEQDVIGFDVAGTWALILHADGSLSAPGAPEDIEALCRPES